MQNSLRAEVINVLPVENHEILIFFEKFKLFNQIAMQSTCYIVHKREYYA